MSIRFNPLIFAGLDLAGGGAAGAVEWKSPVANEAALPLVGNSPGDVRVTLDTQHIYVWNDTTSKWIEQNLTIQPVGVTPNPNGASLNLVNDGNVTRFKINLEPADLTNPGVVSTAAQDFAGTKTFQDGLVAVGQIDAQVGVDSTNGTLNLGFGMNPGDTINIGGSGVNINLYGTTFYQDVTNLQVTDKLITVNKDGAIASGFNSGIELEENSVITGYVKTSGDRNSWVLKAPNTAGTVTLTPGAAGITLDESTSDLLPLSGVRAMTGALDVGFNNINNVSTIQGGAAPIIIESNGFRIKSGGQTYAEFDTVGSLGVITFSKDLSLNNNDLTNVASISMQSGISSYGSITLSGSDLKIEAVADLRLEAASQIKAMAELSMESAKIVNLSPGTAGTDAVNKNQLDAVTANFTVMNEPTGFVNRTDSEVLFTDGGGNPTFTIQPKAPATSYDVYVKGVKYTKTVAATVTSISHPGFPYAGNNYFYFDDSGVLQVTNTFTAAIIQQYAFISIVYWNPDTNSHTYFAEERHGLTMDGVTHSYLHTVFGSRYLSGLALQNFTVGTGGANADAQFDVDQGSLRDEDILIQIAAQAQIPILYRQGSNGYWRKKTADSFPLIYSGTAGYTGANGRLPYNQFSGGSWSLTEVNNNKYVLVHFFGTNDIENGVVGIQGPAEHDSMEAARTAASSEITSLSGLPFAEFVPIGTVVFQTSNTFANTPKADVVPIDGANYIDFRGTQLYTPAGTATTHGLLSGLANDDHFQYLLVDGTRAMSGALNMGTHQINNVTNPTSAQDAATKNYVDGLITSTTPLSVSSSNNVGVATTLARADHTHQGVNSISKSGDSALYGSVTLTGNGAAVLTQTGQNIEIGVARANLTEATSSVLTITGGSNSVLSPVSIEVIQASISQSGYLSSTDFNTFNNKPSLSSSAPSSVGGLNLVGIGTTAARSDHTHQGVGSISKSGDSALYGTVTLTGNGAAVLTQTGQNIEIGVARANLTEATSSVLTITGGSNSVLSPITIEVKLAGIAQSGYLSSTDWNTFNNKQPAGSYITALTGEVTASGPGSVAATITNNAVTNSKLAQMPANTIKGNNTGLSADPLDLTATQVTAMLNQFTTTLQGLVPGSGGGTTNFLRADGTWAAPTATGVTSISVASANGLAGTSSGGSTPILTLSTTITGVLKGDGTSISAATAGTDYVIPSGSITGTASNVTGTVAIANGGTGQTTQQTAIDALAGAVTSGQYLRGNGTNVIMSAIQVADVPTLNQNTTGTAANITATTNNTITTLSSLSLPGSQVTGDISGNAANVTGTVAIANGGTGQTTQQTAINALAGAVTSGQYLRGNGTNVVMSAIQAGDVPTLNQNTTGSSGSVVFTATAGENLTAGDVVYVSSGASDGGRTSERVYKVDAANVTSPDTRIEFSGFVVSTVTSGNLATIQIAGEISGFAGLTVGSPVFASTSVTGGVQSAVPSINGQWIIPVGVAKSATTITINGALSSTATKITGSSAGQFLNVATVSSNTTLTNTNDVVLVSGNTQITLPVPSSGKTLTIKKTDAVGTTTVIVPAGSETIDGLPSFSIAAQYQSVSLTTDGTNWFII